MVSAHGIMISSTMRQAYEITAVRMKETAVIPCVSLEFRTDVEVKIYGVATVGCVVVLRASVARAVGTERAASLGEVGL